MHKNLKDRECIFCGNIFKAKVVNVKYCSRKCSKKAEYQRKKKEYIKRSKKWYQNNIDRAKEKRRDYYWSNPEYFRMKTKEWNRKNLAIKKKSNQFYKDKKRHGNQRTEMIKKYGLKCFLCGFESENKFDIVMHHTSFNPQSHENQILLCRSCHAKEHGLGKLIHSHGTAY